MTQAADSQTCCTSEWEAAYLRFETPEEETRKFTKRLRRMGVESWSRDLRIVEMFCGRGNALVAWERMGFGNLTGIDLSAHLLEKYIGPARHIVADCRRMPLEDESHDVMSVQGGLHHLPVLPDDLQTVLKEVHRVLTPGGRFLVVEPWRTPFLDLVHAMCRVKPLRLVWPKLDACATMIDHEIETYENWLGRPEELLQLFQSHFHETFRYVGWGKIYFLGQKI